MNTIKPRHHYAMLAHKLKAGAHGKSKKAIRKQQKMELKKDIE